MMKRRKLITLAGIAAGSVAAGFYRNEITAKIARSRSGDEAPHSLAPSIADDICLLTPEQEAGPYALLSPVRSDIREDRTGLIYDLDIQVVDANSCKAIPGVKVEIWHCDTEGNYSGYPTGISKKPFDTIASLITSKDGHVEPSNNETYLRGLQEADANGTVSFTTIFPSWYELRMPHIHLRVALDDTTLLTTQLYFDEDFYQNLYRTNPDYQSSGTCPYNKSNDVALIMYPDLRGLIVSPEAATNGHVYSSVKLGVVTA